MNEIQKLVFDLMRKSSFNEFDGDAVADALEARQEMWSGALWGRHHPSVTLRDIENNYYNTDTLLIKTTEESLTNLVLLLNELHADEIDYAVFDADGNVSAGHLYEGTHASLDALGSSNPGAGVTIIRAWWD